MDQFGPFHTDAGWSVVTGQSPTSYERTGRNVRILGFEGNAVVNACVRVVANVIGSVAIQLFRELADGEKIMVPNNAGQALLERPRIAWSAYRLRELTAAHFVSYGNAFWVLERDRPNGLPTSIRIVHPERILYVYLDIDTLEPIQFDWTDRRGIRHHTPWTDVVHFKDIDLSPDAIFGFPRAAAALIDMATDGEASEYVRQIIKNNGSPALIIGMKSMTTEQQAKQADARWHELMAERGQRGRVRFLPGVELVENIGFNLEQLEFPSVRQVSREDICAVFGVDPRMIGIVSARGVDGSLSGQQYHEARRRLYLQTCAPIMTAMESELDLSYAPEWGDYKTRFDPDAISEITEDEEETSVRVTRELQAGILTREEARKKRNMPEAMKPTDTLVSAGFRSEYPVALQFKNDTNLGGDAPLEGANDKPAPAGDGTPGNEPNPKSDAKPPAPAEGTPTDQGGQTAGTARSRILTRGIVLSPDQRDALWRAFDQHATAQEAAYKRTALVQFAVEQRAVHDAVTGQQGRDTTGDPFLTAAALQIASMYAEGGPFYQAWLDRYRALVGETFRTAGDGVAAGTGVSFSLENPLVQQAIADRVTKLADYVTSTTAQQVSGIIAAGRSAGMGVQEIADLIDQSVFGESAGVRALRIARTETVGAMNQGEFMAAKQTGVIRSKEWLTQADDRVRDSHRAMAAVGRVGLSSPFPNGLMHPGDQNGPADEVINCRCALLYSDEAA